jgi:hypothetical protein
MLPNAPPVSRLPFPFGFSWYAGVILTDVISRGLPWTPHGRIHRHPMLGRPPAPRSYGSKRRRHITRRGETGGRCAGSSRTRSTGCASSKDSLPPRLWRTRRRTRRSKRRAMGAGPPERWNPLPPHQEPQRRQRSRRPWWARKRPPPGGP